ncbi:MAG: flagellar biosynthetic protein FliO [Deltaproteobacteria bacterium]|jgi:flagellar protein FliO/FliZ|nr:flagellar biosynthetic protein FliO [Deltaproteobacteria bacterium]
MPSASDAAPRLNMPQATRADAPGGASGGDLPRSLPAAPETQATTAQAKTEALGTLPEYSLSGYFSGLSFLFVLLALLWFGARFLRRQGALRLFGQTPGLEVESRLSLGPKKNLLVLRYRDKRLLLGLTEHHISLLDSSFAEDEDAPEGRRETPTTPLADAPPEAAASFRKLLHGFTRKK